MYTYTYTVLAIQCIVVHTACAHRALKVQHPLLVPSLHGKQYLNKNTTEIKTKDKGRVQTTTKDKGDGVWVMR
jgi:hypothetical protein